MIFSVDVPELYGKFEGSHLLHVETGLQIPLRPMAIHSVDPSGARPVVSVLDRSSIDHAPARLGLRLRREARCCMRHQLCWTGGRCQVMGKTIPC
jgi:hypothetical protein